jgi:acetate kinase
MGRGDLSEQLPHLQSSFSGAFLVVRPQISDVRRPRATCFGAEPRKTAQLPLIAAAAAPRHNRGMARVLVVNGGSSSLKYQVLEVVAHADGPPQRLAGAVIDVVRWVANGPDQGSTTAQQGGHGEDRQSTNAVRQMCAALDEAGLLQQLSAVGHRVVHGGARFTEPVIVDDAVEELLADLSDLAPLHNPPALAAIRAVRAEAPDLPQVAVFDTAFHATLPPHAYTYAVPRELAQRYGVRRYGFHGTSVRYVTRSAAAYLGVPLDEVNVIVCHIGNGASITAVARGRSVDTSMGLTPLEGLVMGTRSGDIDAAAVGYLDRAAGLTAAEVERLLESESGLLGLCGDSDVRVVRRRAAAGDEPARQALDVYAYRLRKYVGAYIAVVPDTQAVVFTGGVGEHDAALRAEVIDPLRHLGLRLDTTANTSAVEPTEPSRIDAGTVPAVLVIPTDEEAEIAAQVLALLGE